MRYKFSLLQDDLQIIVTLFGFSTIVKSRMSNEEVFLCRLHDLVSGENQEKLYANVFGGTFSCITVA